MTANLNIDVTSTVDDAVKGLGDVGGATDSVIDAVSDLGKSTQDGAAAIGDLGSSAGDFGKTASKTTGVLKALSKGFALVGLDGVAQQLGMVAQATTFLKGVGNGLRLVTQTQTGAFLLQKAAMVGSAIASGAMTVVTGAQTAAQWALNAALAANPIGLIIIAVIALVAGFVVLYKKSDTFRGIVQDTGRAGKAAIGWIVDGARELVGWVGDRIPGGFSTAKTLVVTYVKIMTLPLRTTIEVVSSLVGWVHDDLPGAFTAAKNKAVDIGQDMLSPFQDLLDLIGRIIDKIDHIHLPSLGDIGHGIGGLLSRASVSASLAGGEQVVLAQSAPGTVVNVTIQGAIDPWSVVRQLEALFARYGLAFRTNVVA